MTDKDFKDYEAEAAYFASPKSVNDCGEQDLISKRYVFFSFLFPNLGLVKLF